MTLADSKTAALVAKSYDEGETAAVARDDNVIIVLFMVPTSKKRGVELIKKLVTIP